MIDNAAFFSPLSIYSSDTMSACSKILGDKPFLFGDIPSSADLALFGMVCMTTRLPENTVSQLKHHIDKECPNLLRHHKNIVDLFWPDYMTEARWQPGQLQQQFYEPFNTKANFFK